MAVTSTNLDYLVDDLRIEIGDYTAGSYRYLDPQLYAVLVASVKTLRRWWSSKYLIDTSNNVYRNTAGWSYTDTSPPIVQGDDEEPIILMAAIILLEGSLENFSWNVGRWRDYEISYSNIASGNSKIAGINRRRARLEELLVVPTKKLRISRKGSLPGFKGNKHESGADF